MSSPGNFQSTWTMPLLLALLTLFGLLAALLGTGVWHALAWLALLVPIGTGLRYSLWPNARGLTGRTKSDGPSRSDHR